MRRCPRTLSAPSGTCSRRARSTACIDSSSTSSRWGTKSGRCSTRSTGAQALPGFRLVHDDVRSAMGGTGIRVHLQHLITLTLSAYHSQAAAHTKYDLTGVTRHWPPPTQNDFWRRFKSVAAEGFQAPGVVVCYTSNPAWKSGAVSCTPAGSGVSIGRLVLGVGFGSAVVGDHGFQVRPGRCFVAQKFESCPLPQPSLPGRERVACSQRICEANGSHTEETAPTTSSHFSD